MFKTTITELTEYPKWVDSSEGAFVEGYVTVLGIEGIEVYTRKPLDREDFLGEVATVIVGEPEVLSDKWIDDNSVYASLDGITEEYVHVDVLKEILVPNQEITFEQAYEKLREESILSEKSFDYYWNCINDNVEIDEPGNLLVPKQELPVIPKFVAEAIEEDKECGYDVYESIDLIIGTNGGGLPSISDWVARNIDKYARAYLDGFTVEEEQKYYAKIKGHEQIGSNDKYWNYEISTEELDIGDNKVHPDVLAEYMLKATKDEWANLGINKDNADFVKVEEMEQ